MKMQLPIKLKKLLQLLPIMVVSCLITLPAKTQDYLKYPMWNSSLPIVNRVNDLVSRLTLEEKVKQMLNAAPGIPRLGIPAYDWWNEVLHGVARTPFKVTVYPQAIGMAATWDTNSLARMADFSATEGRAIQNLAVKLGRTQERYLGLTYWTPNINIFRDPRWGRGQETYGEDPYLTSMLGRSFVHGLQGDDPHYLKAAACAKHFAVHSGPEPSRHKDNFNPSSYDLWDTYLPAFKELVVNSKVAGVMCAYNAVNTQPCCANDLLLNSILRNEWKFTGYLTSDCGAIDDFFQYHKTHPNATLASVDAVLHGTDVECGKIAYYSLVDGVKKGLIKEQDIDVSVKRLFTIRYRLGMFDPVEKVKFAQIPANVLESAPHQAHSLKMARESMVLLKNENHLLPLSKSLKNVLVLGPNADNKISVLGNYNGTPSEITTVLDGIRKKLDLNAQVEYEKAINFTNDTLIAYNDVINRCQYNGQNGWQADYFNNKELNGMPFFSRQENQVDHFWQEGEQVVQGLAAGNFSARYSTRYLANKTETLVFEVEADDGYRVLVNGKELLNAWQRNRWGAGTFELKVIKDSSYNLVLEYWQGEGKANVKIRSGHWTKTDYANLLQKAGKADVIVFAGGISPQLEGEEMKVNFPGFNGGDRTTIQLPEIQTRLLQQLQAAGKPVVFVMMTGSALAIPWENEHLPAIVNAWYAGQSAGTAVADVLFGDYNPAGRLPITFYASDSDLPGFSDYSMKNRTYRYFTGKPLYPFGHGLSYSTFQYSQLQLPAVVEKGKSLKLKVKLTNTGSRDGEEVVQVYVSYKNQQGMAPLRALKGFKRLALKAGESKLVEFELKAEQLSLVTEQGQLIQPNGPVTITVGGGQPEQSIQTTSNTVGKTVLVKEALINK